MPFSITHTRHNRSKPTHRRRSFISTKDYTGSTYGVIPEEPYKLSTVDTDTWKAKDPEGKEHTITAAISALKEGPFLYNLVKHERMHKCVEVGFACGVSAMFMMHAMEDAAELGKSRSLKSKTTSKKHSSDSNLRSNGRKSKCTLISIDPNQTTQWHNVGSTHVKQAGFKWVEHTLMEEPSYSALPTLLLKQRSTFDLVFVDGMHTFDYTFVDVFYGILLLRNGGYLVIDDAHHTPVQAVIQYLVKNYVHIKPEWRCLQYLETPAKSFAVFRKIRDDQVGVTDNRGNEMGRKWNFHVPFATGLQHSFPKKFNTKKHRR